MFNFKFQSGQSIFEAILAIAIFIMISITMASLVLGGFQGLSQGGQQTEAEALAGEGIEAVRSIRDRSWNELVYTTSSVFIDGSGWDFVGEGSTDTIGKYNRTISFADVCRDGLDDMVDCPGTYTDVHSKKVKAEIDWQVREGITNLVQRAGLLTNWDAFDWIQTNWSGGSGQTIWSDTTKYDSDDSNVDVSTVGEVSLASTEGGGCGVKQWPFTTPTNYTYDSAKIEVLGGWAQLEEQVGGSASGNTLNPDFDTDTSSWTYNDWHQTGGESNVTGSRQSSGGNPSGWVDVYFPTGKSDEFGGFWEQPFDTTVASPTVLVDFDWQVAQYDPTPNTFQLYVFVDSASGAPTIGQQVWSSGEISGTQSWSSEIDIDASSRVSSSGTYYLKLAVWVETPGSNIGPFQIGYDNALLEWSESGASSYPTDKPTINPNDPYTASGIDTWSSFTETATKNGGEIYYQLSDDSGATWRYWSGSSWVLAGSTQYNIASTINTNINQFSTSSGNIMFKAFLESDGSQLVRLDNIQVNWTTSGGGGGGGYVSSGYLISSAFDMGEVGSPQTIEWDEVLPVCDPVCQITFQLRTAPDSGGSPGVWSGWYGVGGLDTYFTVSFGSLVPLSLPNNQWMQYNAILEGDQSDTPVLSELQITY